MTYQGYLVDANGNPLATSAPANYNVIFRIYDVPQDGTPLWSEEQIVTVDNGNFSVLLGEGSQVGAELKPNLSTVFTGDAIAERYIGITITVGTTPSVIAPRVRLLPAPYAFTATSAFQLLSPGGAPVVTVGGQGLEVVGTVSAERFSGDGSALTGPIDSARLDPDLQDLADGSLSGSKVGPGIKTANLTGTIPNALLDPDLQDLADGELTGSKVGPGIKAANLTGTISSARLDTDLQDLADGSLTGSKVGSGIYASRITIGTLPASVMPTTVPLGAESLRIVRGYVNNDKAILAGSGFTVSHSLNSGVYTINFATAFTGIPAVTVSSTHPVLFASVSALSSSKVTITVKTTANTFVDWSFCFIAIGPR
jgi:hypothetical protein